VLELFWSCVGAGVVLELCRGCAGAVLELCWSCSGVVMELCWSCAGVVLELCWSCAEVVLELRWSCASLQALVPQMREARHTNFPPTRLCWSCAGVRQRRCFRRLWHSWSHRTLRSGDTKACGVNLCKNAKIGAHSCI
jgi:hypothetical protein